MIAGLIRRRQTCDFSFLPDMFSTSLLPSLSEVPGRSKQYQLYHQRYLWCAPKIPYQWYGEESTCTLCSTPEHILTQCFTTTVPTVHTSVLWDHGRCAVENDPIPLHWFKKNNNIPLSMKERNKEKKERKSHWSSKWKVHCYFFPVPWLPTILLIMCRKELLLPPYNEANWPEGVTLGRFFNSRLEWTAAVTTLHRSWWVSYQMHHLKPLL